jgi:hypothetical protein
LILSSSTWAQETNSSAETNNPAYVADGISDSNFGMQGSTLYYLGDGSAPFVIGTDGRPKLIPKDNQGEPYPLNGVPDKAGWFLIGTVSATSSQMTVFYSNGYKTVKPGAHNPSSAACHQIDAHWSLVPNYTIKIKYDNDGTYLFNYSYTDWYVSVYIDGYSVPEATTYYCGSPQITVTPPHGLSKFPAGNYTLSWIDNHTSSAGSNLTHEATVTVEDDTPPPPPPVTFGPTNNYTGQWIASNEDRWGLTVLMNFASNSNYIFVPWYTYNTGGSASWYIFEGDSWSANDVFTAPVSLYTGSRWGVMPYDNSSVSSVSKGLATLTFTSATTATFYYNVDGSTRSIALSKLNGELGLGSYTGQWASSAENSWGLTVLEYNIPNSNPQNLEYFFVPWYIYDSGGNALWYIFEGYGGAPGDTFSAGVCRYKGSHWGTIPYDNSQVSNCMPVGNATLNFTSSTTATFFYSITDGGATTSRTVDLVKLQ